MLRANVGLSRKVSRDYNSTGFSVNLDGEINAPPSDPEGVIEQVKELFDLAEEALNQQIERYEGTSAIASRDEEPHQPAQSRRNESGQHSSNGRERPSGDNGSCQSHPQPDGNRRNGDREEPATNKQIQYLLSIGKRQKLSTAQLEQRIAEILGRKIGVYDLSKQAAGVVIEALTSGASTNGTRAR